MIDAELRTLHVRCGTDIRNSLRQAGFAGDFLEYSDPVCDGPVPDLPDLIETRARFLSRAYGWFKGQTEAQISAGLRESEDRLATAHRRADGPDVAQRNQNRGWRKTVSACGLDHRNRSPGPSRNDRLPVAQSAGTLGWRDPDFRWATGMAL